MMTAPDGDLTELVRGATRNALETEPTQAKAAETVRKAVWGLGVMSVSVVAHYWPDGDREATVCFRNRQGAERTVKTQVERVPVCDE